MGVVDGAVAVAAAEAVTLDVQLGGAGLLRLLLSVKMVFFFLPLSWYSFCILAAWLLLLSYCYKRRGDWDSAVVSSIVSSE